MSNEVTDSTESAFEIVHDEIINAGTSIGDVHLYVLHDPSIYSRTIKILSKVYAHNEAIMDEIGENFHPCKFYGFSYYPDRVITYYCLAGFKGNFSFKNEGIFLRPPEQLSNNPTDISMYDDITIKTKLKIDPNLFYDKLWFQEACFSIFRHRKIGLNKAVDIFKDLILRLELKE